MDLFYIQYNFKPGMTLLADLFSPDQFHTRTYFKAISLFSSFKILIFTTTIIALAELSHL